MLDCSRALGAAVLSVGLLGATATVTQAAPAAVPTAALKRLAPAQSLAEPVHYRCVVRRCGPYRCFWVNRCRGWRRWW